MDLPEEAKRAPSTTVWNQIFRSPKVQSVRGALFRNIRHNLSGSPLERLSPSAIRRTRLNAVVTKTTVLELFKKISKLSGAHKRFRRFFEFL